MATSPWRYSAINTLGTLGYFSVIVQWTWCLITLGRPLLTAERPLFLPQAEPVVEPSTVIDFGVFTPFVSLIALCLVVLLMMITVITLWRLPKTIGKKGSQVTHGVATQIIRRTHLHHPLPAKQRIKLSFRITSILKFIVLVLPFSLLFITPAVEGLGTQIVTTIGALCFLFSFMYFFLQIVLTLVFKLDKKRVW